MALITVDDIVSRVQDHLDDPAGRRFKPDYIRPKIDSARASYMVTLERLGCEQQDQEALIDVPACTSAPLDLTPYLSSGKPLQYLMRPKYIDWKLQGSPDLAYTPSAMVSKLADVGIGNVGCPQYRWAGTLLLTPSYTAVTLRVGFTALTDSIYDAGAQVMRGIGEILALMAAVKICALNNNLGNLGAALRAELTRDKQNFVNLIVMQDQRKLRVMRGTKRGGAAQISAGGARFM